MTPLDSLVKYNKIRPRSIAGQQPKKNSDIPEFSPGKSGVRPET